ncbi:MAG: PIG-L family deacetylase [Kiritimatiellae bacterium]|nr:PIG-L family deacetylase [Kiritimatiellia bacterium]
MSNVPELRQALRTGGEFAAPSPAQQCPEFAAKLANNLVFLGAHPDDLASEMGTALLLARAGFGVHVIDYTHGERGCGEEKYRSGWTRRTRTAEEEAVCAALGATLHWFEEIDGEAYAGRESVAKLADLFSELKPRAVILHWPIDEHLDHVMAYAAGLKALQLAGLSPEVYFHLQESQARGFQPFVYVDVTSVVEEKTRLIGLYACQSGPAIAERKKDAQAHFGMTDGRIRSYLEPYALMAGTATPSRCVFTALKEATF